jgi:hypothetical protein
VKLKHYNSAGEYNMYEHVRQKRCYKEQSGGNGIYVKHGRQKREVKGPGDSHDICET